MKKSFTISFFALITFFLLVSSVKAQRNTAVPAEWKALYKDQYTEVTYKYADCSSAASGISQQNVLLKFTNLTSGTVKVEWKNELWYDNKCYNCDGLNNELSFNVVLLPGETKTGACADEKKNLKIFSRFLDNASPTVLTSFKVKDVTVTTVQ